MSRARGLAFLLAVVPCAALALRPNEIPHWMKLSQDGPRVEYLDTNSLRSAEGQVLASILYNRKDGSLVKYLQLSCKEGLMGQYGGTEYRQRMQGGGASWSEVDWSKLRMAAPGDSADAATLRKVCELAADPRRFGWGQMFYDPETGYQLVVPRGMAPLKGERGSAGMKLTDAMKEATVEALVRLNKLSDHKRAPHVASAQAHRCLNIRDTATYGRAANYCDAPLTFAYCAYRSERGSFAQDFDCEKGQAAYLSVGRHGVDLHAARAMSVHWFACREGSAPVFDEFVPGRGIAGRCVKL